MIQRLRPCAFTLLLAGLVGPSAWADRPLVSETADVIGPQACQIEVAAARERTRGQPRTSTLDTLFSCGNRWNSQFGVQYSRAGNSGQTTQRVGLVGKTTLVAPETGRTGFGVAYGWATERAPGMGWKQSEFKLLGAATRPLGKSLLGHANLGWSRDAVSKQSTTAWAVGLEGDAPFNAPFKWAADLYGDDRSKPWASAGVLLPVVEGFSLNAAYAKQLGGERSQQMSVGAKLEF